MLTHFTEIRTRERVEVDFLLPPLRRATGKLTQDPPRYSARQYEGRTGRNEADMVEFSEQLHRFDAPIHAVALAHSLRFPSPYSTHVISSDVISRIFTPDRTIRTTRLILKRGKMPIWAPRGLVERTTSWVLEESEVDLEGNEGSKEIRTRSRNIDHKTVMQVCEWQSFKPLSTDHSMSVSYPLRPFLILATDSNN